MTHYALDWRTVVGRKAHRCVLCGATIPQGERHEVWTYAYEGTVYRDRGHSACVQWNRSIRDPWDDELMDAGEFRDAVNERFPDAVKPWAARPDTGGRKENP